MKMGWLESMSDREVVARLEELLREERRLTASVLAHLGEVEARRLYLPAACSSMHVYCVRVLGMSDDKAYKRIRAARVVRRFPVLAAAVAEGRLHLTAVVMLAPHLTDENAAELVAEASGKSKADIEILLAQRAPRADVPARLDRVAEQALLVVQGPVGHEVVPGPVPVAPQVAAKVAPQAAAGVAPQVAAKAAAQVAAKVAPLSPERFALQLTIGEETRGKLLRAQALLRPQVPSGDLAEVLDRALDALIEKVEARKFGRVKKPRAAKASRSRRYVPREARREAVARDGARCAFVAEDGRRCEETGFLELDHVVPVAQGGDADDGVRILCRSHNQYEAERILGRDAVAAGRAATAVAESRGGGGRCAEPRREDGRRSETARWSGERDERNERAVGSTSSSSSSPARPASSPSPAACSRSRRPRGAGCHPSWDRT
jgi:hypothetical protein